MFLVQEQISEVVKIPAELMQVIHEIPEVQIAKVFVDTRKVIPHVLVSRLGELDKDHSQPASHIMRLEPEAAWLELHSQLAHLFGLRHNEWKQRGQGDFKLLMNKKRGSSKPFHPKLFRSASVVVGFPQKLWLRLLWRVLSFLVQFS